MGSLCILLCPFKCFLGPMGPNRFLCVLMVPYVLLWVRMRPYGSF